MSSSHSSELFTPAAILIGSLIIAGAIMSTARGGIAVTPAGSPPATQERPVVDSAKVSADGIPYVGNRNAKLTIAYWSDYQCPFCKQYETIVLGQLVQEYVGTGKVKILFKDLQFLGPDSIKLGKMSRAVWEVAPAKYYAWHQAIYENQGEEHSSWATDEFIARVSTPILGSTDTARAMSLSVSKAEEYQAAIDADKAEAVTYGLGSTPTSIIGTTVLVGARPYAEVKAAIDAALK